MQPHPRWTRALVIVGLLAIALGTLDPLEGSLAILVGIALVTQGAFLDQNPLRGRMSVALVLGIVGVGTLWGLSAIGGIGGRTGRSMWWALALLPYPITWALGIASAIQLLRGRATEGA
jgi:4-hydroxybenzoate polyprenyltransferase